jgi:hypothetical protein
MSFGRKEDGTWCPFSLEKMAGIKSLLGIYKTSYEMTSDDSYFKLEYKVNSNDNNLRFRTITIEFKGIIYDSKTCYVETGLLNFDSPYYYREKHIYEIGWLAEVKDSAYYKWFHKARICAPDDNYGNVKHYGIISCNDKFDILTDEKPVVTLNAPLAMDKIKEVWGLEEQRIKEIIEKKPK